MFDFKNAVTLKIGLLYQIFTKHVSVCQFALEFANPLGPQYTRDFKIKVFLGLFHNFDAASFKQFDDSNL